MCGFLLLDQLVSKLNNGIAEQHLDTRRKYFWKHLVLFDILLGKAGRRRMESFQSCLSTPDSSKRNSMVFSLA